MNFWPNKEVKKMKQMERGSALPVCINNTHTYVCALCGLKVRHELKNTAK